MPPTQNLVLRYQQTGGIWQSLSIPEGNLLIGRKSDSYLKLSGGDVSRHHAEIRRRGDQVWIVDLGSRNGTWINGKPLPRQVPQPFIPGQSITIGNYKLTLDHPRDAREVTPIPATGGRGGFVFISYSRKDKNLVDPFISKLQNDGFTIWIDRKDIRVGSRWDEEIVRAIHEAEAFLLLLSPDSAASDYVADELRVARGAKAHIMPVILQPVAVPASMKLNLAGRQHIDIFRDPATGYSQLLQGLHARREYLRQHPELAPKPYHQMEMILERESLRSFTQEKQQRLLAFLAQTSSVPVSNFSMAGAYAGSVRVVINMPTEAAYRIKALALNGDPVLVQAGISALRLVGEAQFIPTGGGPPPAAGQPPGQPSGGGSPPAAPAGGLSKMSLLLGGAAIVIVTIGIGLLAGTRPETEPTSPPVTPETQVVPIPSVSFTSADETAAEDDDVLTLTTMLSSVHDQDVTIPYTLSGSAEQVEDYRISPDPLVIPAGERTADLTIQILDDDQVEATEEILVNLEQPENADLGTITEYRATITDNDAPPIVYFDVEAQSVEEDAGNVIITANLSETFDHDVIVPYFLGGSATQGEDFIFDADSFVIQAGELSTELTVNIIDDQISEEIKDVVVTMDTPVNASLGILTEHIITIFDDEEPGIIVDPISGLQTNEGGSSANFEIFLLTKPRDIVTIAISSSDVTEGKIDKSTLTFTRDNWDVAQAVTVTGVNDTEEDGDISYTIIIEPASSEGLDYDGIDPPDVAITNVTVYECKDDIGCIDIPQGESALLGLLLDYESEAALSDAAQLGIEKAIEDYGGSLELMDASGSMANYQIELIREDALCNPDGGESGASRLASFPNLVGVIGTICDDSAVEISESTPPYPEPVDTFDSATILVFDSSGSMKDLDQSGSTKLNAAKAAGQSILAMIKAESLFTEMVNTQVGLVDFNYLARVDAPLSTDISTVENALRNLNADGYTGMPDGLITALDQFTPITGNSKPILILLSDGVPNVGHDNNDGIDEDEVKQQVLTQAERAKDMGVCIYSVGFGIPGATSTNFKQSSIDEELLKQVAKTSGCGTYYNAQNAVQLANVFIELRHVSTGEILLAQEGSIAQDAQETIGSIQVPGNQSMLLYTLNWPDGKLDPILFDPLGKKIDQNYTGASISVSQNIASVIVDNPLSGQWQVEAFGEDVPQGSATYNAIVSSRASAVTPSLGLGALPVLSDAGSVLISPGNTAPGLTDPAEAWEPGYYRTSPNDLQQAEKAANFASFEFKEPLDAAIINQDSYPFSGLNSVFKNTYGKGDGNITYEMNGGDYLINFSMQSNSKGSIDYIKSDVLYLPVHLDLVRDLIPTVNEDEMFSTVKFIMMHYLTDDESLYKSLPESYFRILITWQYLDSQEFRDFSDEIFYYQDSIQTEVPLTLMEEALTAAYAYDATNLLLTAITQVAEIDAIGDLHIRRQVLRDTLTSTRNFPGITGLLTCSTYGDCARQDAFEVFELSYGYSSYEYNWPPEPYLPE